MPAAALSRSALQQVNVRAVGLVRDVDDIRKTVIKTQNGTPVRISDIATVEQGTKIRLGQVGHAIQREDGKIFDNAATSSKASCFLRKGANAEPTLDAIHEKVTETQRPRSALGRENRSLPGPQRPGPSTPPTPCCTISPKASCWWSVILFLFLGNARSALDRRPAPFRSRCCSRPSCLNLRHIPANLLSLGALGFRHGGGWRGCDGREHRAPPRPPGGRRESVRGPHSRGRARGAAARVLRHRHHHHCLPADLHPAARGGPSVQAHGLDRLRSRCSARSFFHADRAGAFELPLPVRRCTEWHNPVLRWITALTAYRSRWAIRHPLGWSPSAIARRVGLPPISSASGSIGSEFLPHLDEGADLGPRHVAPSTGPSRRHPRREPGSRDSRRRSRK